MAFSRVFRSSCGAFCALLLSTLPSVGSAQVLDDFEQGSFNLSSTTFASGLQQFLLPIHCITTERADRMFINGNPSGADLNLVNVDNQVTTVWGNGGGRLEFDYDLAASSVDLTYGGTKDALRVFLPVAVAAGRVEVLLQDGGSPGTGASASRQISGPGAYSIPLSEFVGVDVGDVHFIQLALDVPDFGDYHISDFRAWDDPSIAAGMDVTVGQIEGPPYPTGALQIAMFGMDAAGTTVQTEILALSLTDASNSGPPPATEMTATDSGGGIGMPGEQVVLSINDLPSPGKLPHFRTWDIHVGLLPGPEHTSVLAILPTIMIDPTMRSAAMHFATYAMGPDGDTHFRADYYLGFETPVGSELTISGMGVDPVPFFGDQFFDITVDVDGPSVSASGSNKQGQPVLSVQMNASSYSFGAATGAPHFTGNGSLALWAQPNVMGASTQLWMSRVIASDMRLRLYDLAGRAVQTVTIPAGKEFAVWDGRDAHGRTVASGMYLLRALDAPNAESAKIVKLR